VSSSDQPTTSNTAEAVLITGCSSGIGRATAVHLARHGFLVFATVRKSADADELRGLGESNLIPVCPLDLTRREHILGAREIVAAELGRRSNPGLRALVCNAGGGGIAPIELMDLESFRAELDARVVGSVALLQAFLPLLRKGFGRVVWVTTPALMPTLFVSEIHACDFAVNCIARTLDLELKPWNIPSIMVRCGGIKTPAVAKSAAELEQSLLHWPEENRKLYEKALRSWSADMVGFDSRRSEPEVVAETVRRTLIARKPKRRYSVGYMAGAAAFLEALPQPLADWILAQRFKRR
jgi:NAD(P)-dependent dehydrogenase (short-subunit alcohol dehydrogenase family)